MTEGLIGEEQGAGALRRGSGCVDQIFALKQLLEKMRGRRRINRI